MESTLDNNYVANLIDAFDRLDFDEILLVRVKDCGHFPVLKGYDRAPYNTLDFIKSHFEKDPASPFDVTEPSRAWVLAGNTLVECDITSCTFDSNLGFDCENLPDSIDGSLLRTLYENETLYDNKLFDFDTWYYPFSYVDSDLRALQIGQKSWRVLCHYPYGINDLFVLTLLHNLPTLSTKVQLRFLQELKNRYVSKKSSSFSNAFTFETSGIKELAAQEWMFHTKTLLELVQALFVTTEQKTVWNFAMGFCRDNLHDILPSKVRGAVIPYSCDAFPGFVIRKVFDWLCENGHIDVNDDQKEIQFKHFFYIVTGRNREQDELRTERFVWSGNNKYVFVTFIKEIHKRASDNGQKKRVDWSSVPNRFDTPFENEMNSVWAKTVTDTAGFKKRAEKQSQAYQDISDLTEVFYTKV